MATHTTATPLILGATGAPGIYSGAFDPTVAGQAAAIASLFLRTDTGQLYTKTGVGDTAWTLAGSGSGGALAAFTYTCTGAEGDSFTITIPGGPIATDDYIVQVTPGGVTALYAIDCPDIAPTDRTTTEFLVETSAAVQAGDRLDVVLTERT